MELGCSSLYVCETLYIYLSDIEDTRFVSSTLAVTLQVGCRVFLASVHPTLENERRRKIENFVGIISKSEIESVNQVSVIQYTL